MSKLKSALRLAVLLIASFVIGLGIWFFRETNIVAQVVIDAAPLTQDNGMTNVAVLGVGGEGHEGGDLTDTILLVSLRHSDHSIKLISVPRDIWVASQKIKINAAYHYGNEKGSGQGLVSARAAISETLGIPVQYAALIDFSGFIKLIDIVGGVDINVKNTFDDYKYPIPGKETAEPESDRYEHLHFEAGQQHMDGVTALKFARSRHAEGEEGTDFARGARQQQIVAALKTKILSSQTLLSFNTLNQIVTSLKSSIDTDITQDYYRSFFQFGLSFKSSGGDLQSGSIESYLTNPKNLTPYGGAWVLIPNKDLKDYVAKFLAE